MIKKLYVRFAGDNDFSNTMAAFVRTIAPRIWQGDWENITKSEIVSLFNEHGYSLYCLHQARGLNSSKEEKERLKAYLQIAEKDVYFDDEAGAYFDFNHDGCLAVIHKSGFGDGDIYYTIM